MSSWNWPRIKFRKTAMCQKLKHFTNSLKPHFNWSPVAPAECSMYCALQLKYIFYIKSLINLWLATMHNTISSRSLVEALNICMVSKQVSGKYRAANTDLEATPLGTEESSPFSWGASLCVSKASPSARQHTGVVIHSVLYSKFNSDKILLFKFKIKFKKDCLCSWSFLWGLLS